MTVAVLVPRRPDGDHRDRLWRFVRDWWAREFPAFKVVEGVHDDGGPFNRSAALNVAAVQAGSWDVAVVADADVIGDPDQIVAAVELSTATGRATLAFDRFVYVGKDTTGRVLDGYVGTWETGRLRVRPNHESSLVIVPRRLWDEVGGFDARFRGWGAEDEAFAQTCRVLGGGVDRIAGGAWHLWHPDAPGRARTGDYRASVALLRRYQATNDPAAMRRLIGERSTDYVIVVPTDGRRACIVRAVASLRHLYTAGIGRQVIVDDSGDREYAAFLRLTFGRDWEIVTAPKRSGFAQATRRARAVAVESGQPWVWWHEDDFELAGPVDLDGLRDLLVAYPHLAQVALLRQPWWPGEVAAGGIIPERPDLFVERSDSRATWVEHTAFWTQNPHLTSRRLLAETEWPSGARSEHVYGRRLLVGDVRSAFIGGRDDPPRVTHIGDYRAGTGY